MRIIILIFIFLIHTNFISALALDEKSKTYNNNDNYEEEVLQSPENVLYGDLGYLYFSGYFTLNYERVLADILAIRVGYGYGSGENFLNNSSLTTGSFFLGMFEILLSHSENRMEIGAGMCLSNAETFVNENSAFGTLSGGGTSSEYRPYLALTIGYRNQSEPEGSFLRIGFSIIGFTYGFNASIGFTF